MKVLYSLILTIFISSEAFSQTDFDDIQQKNIVYAAVGSEKLLLDLYLPANKQDPYLIVWIHGGAWQSGSKESPPLGLIGSGYGLASVNYRLSEEAIFPAQIHDLKAAIRFLRAHAKEYGFRADRIVVWGSSAGGHLAALLATTNNDKTLEGNIGDYLNESSSVQGCIDFFGPTNLTTILQQSTPHGLNVRVPALTKLLGKPLEQVLDLAKLASPVYHVDPSDPPIFIAHGDQDIQVPINQSLELEGAYKKNNLSVELEIVHGAGHGSPDYFSPLFYEKVNLFLLKLFP